MNLGATMPPLVLTMGEPAGIGGEVALKAWIGRRDNHLPPFCMIADENWLLDTARRLGLSVSIEAIDDPAQTGEAFIEALPVLRQDLVVPVRPGHPDPTNARGVIESIRRAHELVALGKAGAMITNPIQKHSLQQAGFAHPGHTEYLGHLSDLETPPVMMLACPGLRVVPITVHVSLARAAAMLERQMILHAARTTHKALIQDFGIPSPRLAVAGLNPHAGEEGSMGREELDIIIPAVEQLQAEGLDIRGPLPADTMFHEGARANYDAALCMYHDQALIPLKTIDFFGGVNVTLGLPVIRTSPDHGTALDRAGTGEASPDSLIAAIRMAGAMATRRQTS